jgi:hypothetical protein
VPGPETLTFFVHQHHSRTGSATLLWWTSVAVNGTGVGPTWYSSGAINVPLLCGHHYVLGVSWAGTLTYYYNVASTGAPVSFGAWIRAITTTNLPAASITITGNDGAQYYQRLTTVPIPVVNCVGTGCSSSSLAPRLLASDLFRLGVTTNLDLYDAAASTLAVNVLAEGAALATPLPMFGCSVWLNLAGGTASMTAITSGTGTASLPLAVPQNQNLRGAVFTAQTGILRAASVDISNAIEFTIN